MNALRRLAAALAIAAAVGLMGVYVAAADGPVREWSYLAALVGSGVAAAIGARRSPYRVMAPLIAVGVGVSAGGDVVWQVLAWTDGVGPDVSVADGLWLGAYVALGAALLRAPATDRFISIAEETGIIVPIGKWVLAEACATLARWRGDHPRHHELSMAVNVSTRQLTSPDLDTHVVEALGASGIDARSLVLEITETALAQDSGLAASPLRQRDHLRGERCDRAQGFPLLPAAGAGGRRATPRPARPAAHGPTRATERRVRGRGGATTGVTGVTPPDPALA